MLPSFRDDGEQRCLDKWKDKLAVLADAWDYVAGVRRAGGWRREVGGVSGSSRQGIFTYKNPK